MAKYKICTLYIEIIHQGFTYLYVVHMHPGGLNSIPHATTPIDMIGSD